MDNLTVNSFNPVTSFQINTGAKYSANSEKIQPTKSSQSDFNSVKHYNETQSYTYSFNGNAINQREYFDDGKERPEPEELTYADKIREEVKKDREQLEQEKFERRMFPPLSFNYDNESRNFFVKVEKGNYIKEVIQYPREAMMDWKIYHKQLIDEYV